MRYAAEHLEPTQGARSTCPACGSPVIAKCGRVMVWHWAHEADRDCDPWSEPMTKWHLMWQQRVPPEQREVVIGPHRADIVIPLPDGPMVVEIQHSGISVEEIREREEFYGRMIWIFDATEAARVGNFEAGRPLIPFIRSVYNPETGSYQDEPPAPWAWRWKRGRTTIRSCQRPVLLDGGHLLVNPWDYSSGNPLSGEGNLFEPDFEQLVKARAPRTLR